MKQIGTGSLGPLPALRTSLAGATTPAGIIGQRRAVRCADHGEALALVPQDQRRILRADGCGWRDAVPAPPPPGEDDGRALTDWAVCRDDAGRYKPPEWNPLYLAGCCDGRDITAATSRKYWHRACIARGPGSIYRLVGDPRPDYVEFCAKNGIALDLADPIKIKK